MKWKIKKRLTHEPENSLKFSEESSRIIHEMDNFELYELGQISRTVQCHSCLNEALAGGIDFLFSWRLSST